VSIEISKPFASYLAIEELPKTRDAREFKITLPFEVEGTSRIEQMSHSWSYSGTQEAVDQKAAVDGLSSRRERAIDGFKRAVEIELTRERMRLYAVEGRLLLIRGPAFS
jgi:hypothetical protein